MHLSLAAMHHCTLHQLDIKNAFLHGKFAKFAKFAEEAYMKEPPGFVAQEESNLLCRLKWSIYGLKTVPESMVWMIPHSDPTIQNVPK